MFCFMTFQSLKLLIFIALSTGVCFGQPLQWTCPASSDNETAYFPNIAIDESSLAKSVQGSPYLSGVYAYLFQPVINDSCNSIPLLEFCFEITNNTKKFIVLSILLGSIDSVIPNRTSLTGRIFVQKTINTTVNCNPKLSKDSVCCQSVQINVSLSTQILQQINAFGIEFPDHVLLEYNNSENVVETFIATSLDFRGFVNNPDIQQPVIMIQGNGHFMNLNLRFLRFVIEEPLVQHSNTETDTILVAVLPTVGGWIILFFLLSITVLFFAIKWRKRKKMILSKDPQKAFDNTNYGDCVRVLNNQASNLERSSNVYDYAVASSELDSSIRIVRAVSYEEPLKSDAGTYNEDIYVVPASDEPSLYGQFSQLKMHICGRDNISLKALLGSGQFGTVHKGEWVASEGGEKIEVAVKTLKEEAGEGDKIKFLQEAAIMGQFCHPNVVKLYGIVIEGESVMLILELLPEGDLQMA